MELQGLARLKDIVELENAKTMFCFNKSSVKN